MMNETQRKMLKQLEDIVDYAHKNDELPIKDVRITMANSVINIKENKHQHALDDQCLRMISMCLKVLYEENKNWYDYLHNSSDYTDKIRDQINNICTLINKMEGV